ncbi:MAG: exodeoxyribonuclease VII small subunit [Candidatus Thermofonsia bacterium]|nr:MAG: exodeoxyribonuclease VII small subunit [Candidatus Thermofonsia bacterium]
MESSQENLTFETALLELQNIVNQLEDGDLTLEKSLQLFERGQQLAAYCAKQLDEATLKIEQLTADGEIIELQAD